MSGQTIRTSDTRLEALQLQSSARGVTIPWVRGVTRVAPNLFWYGGFRATGTTTEQGGKGGGQENTTYSYTASLLLGLCHGPIRGVPRVWRGKQIFGTVPQGHTYLTGSPVVHTTLAGLGLTLLPGNIVQPMWSGLARWPTEGLHYPGLAAVAGADYGLGGNAQLDAHMFEVVASLAYHIDSNTPDVDPAAFVRELMLDTQAGAGLPPELMGDLARWSDYCVSAGLLVSPALTEQTTAADVLSTAAMLTCSAISTTGGRIQIVPRADAPAARHGRSYTPNLVPVYDLDDECYTPSSVGASPVKYRLRSNAERYNTWALEYRNRANNYAVEPVDAKDAADIAARGVRANTSTVKADWICDAAAATTAVQLMMQRSVSVLTDYEVPLPPHFSLIDLCDLLTLTDTALGMDRTPVWVTGIDEDDNGDLRITAEDYPIGSASAPALATPEGQGYQPLYNAPPGSVEPPVIFEGPGELSATGLEVYVAAAGLGEHWGGATVWVSADGLDYKRMATINGRARYGALTSAFDMVHNDPRVRSGAGLVVGVAMASGELNFASEAAAALGQSVCWVGGPAPEFVTYEFAWPGAPGAYYLTNLRAGLYGTQKTAHGPGQPFVRIDDNVARSGPLDPSYVGATLHIKLTSRNVYGAAEESLADVPAYTYTIGGGMRGIQPGPVVTTGQMQPGAVTERVTFFDAQGVFHSPEA